LPLGAMLLVSPTELEGGVGARGFFNEYLFLGPYLNPDGAVPGLARQAEDFLCDGTTDEASITPEVGLRLGVPATGSCAASNSGVLESDTPTVRTAHSSGDFLDLGLVVSQSPNVMAYAWTYVENQTSEILFSTLAFSHDDGMQVQVNGQPVFNLSAVMWHGGTGFIQSRVPIALVPGSNLIQFKVFQGSGEWGVRARLEDPVTGRPILAGNPLLRAGIEGRRPDAGMGATRTIAADGSRAVDVTVAVSDAGAPYTLQESFAAGWSVASATGSPVVGPRTITWTNAGVAALSYRLVRTRPFTRDEGTLVGFLTRDAVTSLVAGERWIPGAVQSFVRELFLTPPLQLPGSGCDLAETLMEGPWIGDGNGLTDETVIPRDGLTFRPSFHSSVSQAVGLSPLEDAARAKFWTVVNPSVALARFVRVQSDEYGQFDFKNRIYSTVIQDCVNLASFYALNDAEEALPVTLGIGSDDGTVIRVNGAVVHSRQVCRPHTWFEDKFPIQIRRGKNLISIYTFNGGGEYGMSVRFEGEGGLPAGIETTLDPTGYGELPFLRGDANGDRALDITDPVWILRCLFLDGNCGNCRDASDADDSGEVTITDPIQLLTWRFLNGPPPAAPFPGCGLDPSGDQLGGCEESSCDDS
jgi:hypothetical protein